LGFTAGYVLQGQVLMEGTDLGNRSVELAGPSGYLTIGANGSIKTVPTFTGYGFIGHGSWYGGSMSLQNKGLIPSGGETANFYIVPTYFNNTADVQVANGTMHITPNGWSNASGTIAATQATLNFGGQWVNNGGLIDIANTTVNLGGLLSTLGFPGSGF